MSDEPREEVGAFSRVADWLQQAAAPFAAGRSGDERLRWAPRPPVESLFEAARVGLVGRRVETGEGTGAVAFTLAALDARFDALAANAGQADGVMLVADRVEYAGLRAARVEAELRNVHTRIGMKPVLVASPVDVTVSLGPAEAEAFVARFLPRVTARCASSDRVRLTLARHPRWGWVEAEIGVVGGRVTLRPVAAGRRWLRWRARRRLPAYTLPLVLSSGLRVVGLSVEAEVVTVRLRIDEWRFPYGRILGLARRNI